MKDIEKIAIDYYSQCARLLEIKKELLCIYEKWWQKDYSYKVLEDINSIFKLKKETIDDDWYEYYRDCPLNWYDEAIHKTDFEILNDCFKLYEERKVIKRNKWLLTRKLYLQWKNYENKSK